MTSYNILVPEEFVRKYMEAYNNGDTVGTLAKHYGVTQSAISQRIERYRKLGVALPPLNRARYNAINVTKLNTIINESKKEN